MRGLVIFIALFACINVLRGEDIPCSDLQVRVTNQPMYPPIAKAAHFSGQIELDLRVNAEARLQAIENLSGPLLLQGAARDYVTTWDLSWQSDKKHHPCVEKFLLTLSCLSQRKL